MNQRKSSGEYLHSLRDNPLRSRKGGLYGNLSERRKSWNFDGVLSLALGLSAIVPWCPLLAWNCLEQSVFCSFPVRVTVLQQSSFLRSLPAIKYPIYCCLHTWHQVWKAKTLPKIQTATLNLKVFQELNDLLPSETHIHLSSSLAGSSSLQWCPVFPVFPRLICLYLSHSKKF